MRGPMRCSRVPRKCFDAAVGEAGSIGLLLYEELAGEFFHHSTLAVVFHKGVVLFGCAFRQGLEPVGVVGYT